MNDQTSVVDPKTLATLRAKYALAGFELLPVGDAFVACRWGYQRSLRDIEAVEVFLERIQGGRVG